MVNTSTIWQNFAIPASGPVLTPDRHHWRFPRPRKYGPALTANRPDKRAAAGTLGDAKCHASLNKEA